jgi:hypothetical protein
MWAGVLAVTQFQEQTSVSNTQKQKLTKGVLRKKTTINIKTNCTTATSATETKNQTEPKNQQQKQPERRRCV